MISTLCGPAGRPTRIRGSPLASAQCHGASSTMTWMCPMRGYTSSGFGPNTGTIRKFSARYWMNTYPRDSGSANGGSTMIFAGGCCSVSYHPGWPEEVFCGFSPGGGCQKGCRRHQGNEGALHDPSPEALHYIVH